MEIPKRQLGRTGVAVTILGLGGEGILRTHGFVREAYALINRALDLGITYCESARAPLCSAAHVLQALISANQQFSKSEFFFEKLQLSVARGIIKAAPCAQSSRS